MQNRPPPDYRFDLQASFTFHQLVFVVRLLQARVVPRPFETFEQVCRRLSVDVEQAREAVRAIESYLQASLFYPGREWTPTGAGREFLEIAEPVFNELEGAAIDLGREARAARIPAFIEPWPRPIDIPDFKASRRES